MTLMNFLCRLFPGRCEPLKAEEPAASTTNADLGQKEAKNEALREEQLRQMGGPERSAQGTKPEEASAKRPSLTGCVAIGHSPVHWQYPP
jgi:hypothetical protein